MVSRIKVILVLALFVGVPGWKAYAQPAAIKINAGAVGVMGDAPFYVGLAKGFYEEQGVQVELNHFRSGGTMMAPLGAGKLDVVRGGVNIGLFNSFARGWPVRVVAAGTVDRPGNSPDAFLVRPDLKDQIKTPRDLKGRKIAVNAPASAMIYVLAKALEKAGLSLKDVDMVTLPFGEMGAALRNKAIDVALGVEPSASLLAERGDVVIWKRVPDFVSDPYFQVSILFYNNDWATKNPQAARGFMLGWIKSVRYYYEAANKGPNRAEVVNILTRYTTVKEAPVYDKVHWSVIDPNGLILKDSINDQQEFYFRSGYVKQKADVDKMIDNSYLDYALEKLGRYPTR